MNILEQSETLKDIPEQVLMKEMQMPSGSFPQYLVLTEIKRRKRIRDDFQRRQAQDVPTVAEEAVTAAGIPQEGIMQMSKAMAPKTNMGQNTGMADMMPKQPVMGMNQGGFMQNLMDRRGLVGDTRLGDKFPFNAMGFGSGERFEDIESAFEPVEPFPINDPNPRARGLWMSKYKDTHNLDGTPKFTDPNLADSKGIASLRAPESDNQAPDIATQTQAALYAAQGADRDVPRSQPPQPDIGMDDIAPDISKSNIDALMELGSIGSGNEQAIRDTLPGVIRGDELLRSRGSAALNAVNDPTISDIVPQLGAVTDDAPFTGISASNLEALMGTASIGSGNEPAIRDTLPEVIRNNELLRSRGTASVGAASDPGIAGLDDANQLTDPTLRSMDALIDRTERYAGPENALEIDRGTPSEPATRAVGTVGFGFNDLTESDLLRRQAGIDRRAAEEDAQREIVSQLMRENQAAYEEASSPQSIGDQMIARGFTGGDIDPTRFPTAEEREIAQSIGAINDFGEYLARPKTGEGYVSGMTIEEKIADPIEATRRLFGLGRGAISGMTLDEKIANPREATRRLLGFGAIDTTPETKTAASNIPELSFGAGTAGAGNLPLSLGAEAAATAARAQNIPVNIGGTTIKPSTTIKKSTTTAGAAGTGSLESRIAKAIADREKRAESDKWLALAQTGLMMASGDPADLSKAGQAGLKALTTARAQKDKFDADMLGLQQRIDAYKARIAAAASGKKVDTMSAADVNVFQDRYKLAVEAARENPSSENIDAVKAAKTLADKALALFSAQQGFSMPATASSGRTASNVSD